MKMSFSSGFYVLLVVFLAGFYGWWMSTAEYYTPIDITASLAEETAIQVYAQFSVTQTLALSEPVWVERLVVPMLVPEGMSRMRINLLKKDLVVDSWEFEHDDFESGERVKRANMELTRPQWISGSLEVVFEAPSIAIADQEKAPGLFVETLDLAYPEGNYRIADNQKQGDVSLTLYASKKRWQAVKERYAGRNDRLILWWGKRGLLAAAIAVLPVAAIEQWQLKRRKKSNSPVVAAFPPNKGS